MGGGGGGGWWCFIVAWVVVVLDKLGLGVGYFKRKLSGLPLEKRV